MHIPQFGAFKFANYYAKGGGWMEKMDGLIDQERDSKSKSKSKGECSQ